MTQNDTELHHRKSIRYKGFDYSTAGYYFVTICAQDMAIRFGQIKDGKMLLNPSGKMMEQVWNEIPVYYSSIDIDVFQIMPNHLHGIIIIKDRRKQDVQHDIENCKSLEEIGTTIQIGQQIGQTQGSDPTSNHCVGVETQVGINPCVYPNSSQNVKSNPQISDLPILSDDFDTPSKNQTKTLSLPDIVQRFKSFSTNEYIHGVKTKGWDRFNQKLWQRNYYEHIIRSPQELYDIQTYIINNPLQWELDKNNPNFEINRDEYYKDKVSSKEEEMPPKWMV